MRTQKYVLDKIVLSGGYGNREPEKIKKIKDHLQNLLTTLNEKETKVLVTNCRRPNSVFKLKKHRAVGVKVTLRKQKALTYLKLLNTITPNFLGRLKYNNSTFFMGLDDHKKLKLERYRYDAPEYGLNTAIVFCPLERKSLLRVKRKRLVSAMDCQNCLKTLL